MERTQFESKTVLLSQLEYYQGLLGYAGSKNKHYNEYVLKKAKQNLKEIEEKLKIYDNK